jgi:predicted esterase
MTERHIATMVHGRFLFEERSRERLLVGFHGYGETADTSFAEMAKIPGIEEWSVAAVQALHPFYTQRTIGANWMTSQDRELAIADNVNYVRNVISSLPSAEKLIFLGFSQGATMAIRAAALADAKPAGVIMLGGDIPPELEPMTALPPALLARGAGDEWYTEEKFKQDLSFLEPRTKVTTLVFEGGHEWTEEFRRAAGAFLDSL